MSDCTPDPADGLYAPRPVRTDTVEGIELLALEIPDCCPLSTSCPHIRAIDHPLTLAQWIALLLRYDWEGYRPALWGAEPAWALTRAARVALLVERAEKRRRLYHPEDRLPGRRAWRDQEGSADAESEGARGEIVLLGNTLRGGLRLADPDAPPKRPRRTLREAWFAEDATAEEILALYRENA